MAGMKDVEAQFRQLKILRERLHAGNVSDDELRQIFPSILDFSINALDAYVKGRR